jgi:hypothetical protein
MSSRVTPRIRDLAKRLVAAEAKVASRSTETKRPAAFLVCDRLRPHLATLMGSTGFNAFLSRALALGRSEADWLYAVALTGDGLGLSEKAGEKVGPEVMTEGGVVLVAQLLGLLVAFVGERLTLRIVREVWPKGLNHIDSGDQS